MSKNQNDLSNFKKFFLNRNPLHRKILFLSSLFGVFLLFSQNPAYALKCTCDGNLEVCTSSTPANQSCCNPGLEEDDAASDISKIVLPCYNFDLSKTQNPPSGYTAPDDAKGPDDIAGFDSLGGSSSSSTLTAIKQACYTDVVTALPPPNPNDPTAIDRSTTPINKCFAALPYCGSSSTIDSLKAQGEIEGLSAKITAYNTAVTNLASADNDANVRAVRNAKKEIRQLLHDNGVGLVDQIAANLIEKVVFGRIANFYRGFNSPKVDVRSPRNSSDPDPRIRPKVNARPDGCQPGEWCECAKMGACNRSCAGPDSQGLGPQIAKINAEKFSASVNAIHTAAAGVKEVEGSNFGVTIWGAPDHPDEISSFNALEGAKRVVDGLGRKFEVAGVANTNGTYKSTNFRDRWPIPEASDLPSTGYPARLPDSGATSGNSIADADFTNSNIGWPSFNAAMTDSVQILACHDRTMIRLTSDEKIILGYGNIGIQGTDKHSPLTSIIWDDGTFVTRKDSLNQGDCNLTVSIDFKEASTMAAMQTGAWAQAVWMALYEVLGELVTPSADTSAVRFMNLKHDACKELAADYYINMHNFAAVMAEAGACGKSALSLQRGCKPDQAGQVPVQADCLASSLAETFATGMFTQVAECEVNLRANNIFKQKMLGSGDKYHLVLKQMKNWAINWCLSTAMTSGTEIDAQANIGTEVQKFFGSCFPYAWTALFDAFLAYGSEMSGRTDTTHVKLSNGSSGFQGIIGFQDSFISKLPGIDKAADGTLNSTPDRITPARITIDKCVLKPAMPMEFIRIEQDIQGQGSTSLFHTLDTYPERLGEKIKPLLERRNHTQEAGMSPWGFILLLGNILFGFLRPQRLSKGSIFLSLFAILSSTTALAGSGKDDPPPPTRMIIFSNNFCADTDGLLRVGIGTNASSEICCDCISSGVPSVPVKNDALCTTVGTATRGIFHLAAVDMFQSFTYTSSSFADTANQLKALVSGGRGINRGGGRDGDDVLGQNNPLNANSLASAASAGESGSSENGPGPQRAQDTPDINIGGFEFNPGSGSGGGSGGGGGFSDSDAATAGGVNIGNEEKNSGVPSQQKKNIAGSYRRGGMASGYDDGEGGDYGSFGAGEIGIEGGANSAETSFSQNAAGDSGQVYGQTPDDYFTRIGINENIFKQVERRYGDISMRWVNQLYGKGKK